MKLKSILSFAALSLAMLTLSAPAKAQYYGNEACNQTVNGGFNNTTGSGPNGEFVVRFYVTTTYTMKDSASVYANLANGMVGLMNNYAAQRGYRVRFVATNYYNPQNLNLTIYLNLTDNQSTASDYEGFFYVNGWSQGHLFRFHTGVYADAGSALTDGAREFVDRWAAGWTCGTQQ